LQDANGKALVSSFVVYSGSDAVVEVKNKETGLDATEWSGSVIKHTIGGDLTMEW